MPKGWRSISSRSIFSGTTDRESAGIPCGVAAAGDFRKGCGMRGPFRFCGAGECFVGKNAWAGNKSGYLFWENKNNLYICTTKNG